MKKFAFTLAEVLITLGVIGVVAAITMPTLMQKHKEHVTLNKIKKIYSVMSQALLRASDEQQIELTEDDYGKQSGALALYNYVKPYLKVGKDCGFDEGCFPNLNYKLYDGGATINFITDKASRYMIKLNDGSAIAFYGYDGTDDIIGAFYYDVNGDAGPNQFGKDLFQFMLYKNRIRPYEELYNMNSTMENCYTKGFNCSDWVIKYNNLEYWYCDDLEFGGKSSCKN